MVKIISKVLKVTSSLLITLAVIIAFLLVGMKLFGLQIYTILSPSMEPKYPTGSIIYVKKVDTADLKVKDVVTYQLTDTMTATHRIIELVPDTENPDKVLYRTKGDNNDAPDEVLVESDRVLGKVVFGIPLLGFLANFVQSRSGILVCMCVAFAIVLMVILSDILECDKNNKENQEKNEENPS